MKIINRENLSEAIGQIVEGKVIVFPSETSYGLSCDASKQEAVNKIFSIKGRSGDKPVLVVAASVEMAKKYLEWNEQIDLLAKKYWPGALTIVGRSVLNNGLAKGVVAKDNTIAIRVSAHPELNKISKVLGLPVVSTSANISGANPAYRPQDIQDIFMGRDIMPDALYDVGDLPQNSATTVVKAVDGVVKILRQGEIIV